MGWIALCLLADGVCVHRDMKNLGQQSRRAFIRDLKEVVEQADVILEVSLSLTRTHAFSRPRAGSSSHDMRHPCLGHNLKPPSLPLLFSLSIHTHTSGIRCT